MNTAIGHKIKRLCISKNFSQEHVAEYLGIAQSTYTRIENGETNSWVNYVESICKLYAIEPDELLRLDGITISHSKGTSTNGYIIYNLSEKLIAQYEENAKLKD